MVDMKPYKIAYDYNQPSTRWLRWLFVLQGMLFIAMFGMGYYDNDLNWLHYLQLISGIAIIVVSLLWFNKVFFRYSSAIFSDEGVSYRKKQKETQTMRWNDIDQITLTGDGLKIRLANQTEQELHFPWMTYIERQKAKEQIGAFAESKNVPYSYQY